MKKSQITLLQNFYSFYSRRKPYTWTPSYISPFAFISPQLDISGTNLLLEPKSIMPISKAQAIVGLSGAEKLARRQHGEKKCDPRERGRKSRCTVAAQWLFLLTFFFFFYTIVTCTERGTSVVEILGSPPKI